LKEKELERIERYIKDQTNDNEKTWTDSQSQLLNGEDDNNLRNLLRNDWERMLKESSPIESDLSYILDRVHHIIRENENSKNHKLFRRFIQVYIKAAAILFLPLLITGGLAYILLKYQGKTTIGEKVNYSIYAPAGARVSFKLPDGTNGMLNSESHLSYSLPFKNNREVSLEGEAWFEVYHDKNHPFEISVSNSTVKVLGTSLDVSSFPADKYVEVVLLQGKCEFHDKTSDKKVMILPSERLVFQYGDIIKSVTDPTKYTGWTEGKLVFRGDPATEVARRLEQWYNVKVTIADKEIEKYSFRATFEDDKLEDVLHYLSMTSPIRYQISPRKLLYDGTYEHEKVTIYLKK
jgi:transmembrane sensor